MVRALTLGALLALLPGVARAHPMHTTLTEVTRGADGRVRTMIRVFADDLGSALAHQGTPGVQVATGAEPALTRYLSQGFAVVAPSGAPLPLRGCGVSRRGELLWICLETVSPAPGPVHLRDSLLSEVFPDQVNIVRGLTGATPQSTLFLRGDGVKTVG